MKPINIFIIEKLKISKDSKLYNENVTGTSRTHWGGKN